MNFCCTHGPYLFYFFLLLSKLYKHFKILDPAMDFSFRAFFLSTHASTTPINNFPWVHALLVEFYYTSPLTTFMRPNSFRECLLYSSRKLHDSYAPNSSHLSETLMRPPRQRNGFRILVYLTFKRMNRALSSRKGNTLPGTAPYKYSLGSPRPACPQVSLIMNESFFSREGSARSFLSQNSYRFQFYQTQSEIY